MPRIYRIQSEVGGFRVSGGARPGMLPLLWVCFRVGNLDVYDIRSFVRLGSDTRCPAARTTVGDVDDSLIVVYATKDKVGEAYQVQTGDERDRDQLTKEGDVCVSNVLDVVQQLE